MKKTGRYIRCERCNKRIYVASWQFRTYKHHFCSTKCYQLWQRGNLYGKNIKPMQEHNKIYGVWNKGLKGFGKEFGFQKKHPIYKGVEKGWFGKGEKHPRWEGGISRETNRRIQRGIWKRIKKLALKRDNFTCQNCGSKNNLQVHHIISYELSGDYLDNLITLCCSCHIKEHLKMREAICL